MTFAPETRSGRLGILMRCLSAYVIRGRATKKPAQINNILIAPAGKLGDIVCATPMFRAVRKAYPQARITLLGNKFTKEVLDNGGLFDDFIEIKSFDETIKAIKDKKVDFATLNGTSFILLATLYLARIPLIAAPIMDSQIEAETFPYKLLARFVARATFSVGKYIPAQYLKLLEPIGIHSTDTEKKVGFSDKARQDAQSFFTKHGLVPKKDRIIGVTLTAGNKIKEWGIESFAELIRSIVSTGGYKVVLFGSKYDVEASQELFKQLQDATNVIDSAGAFDIDAFKAAISLVDMFIGVDTGPVYVAEALKIPTIDIVGPVDEREQPPQGPMNMVVKAGREKPAISIFNARKYDAIEARRQVESITPAMVFEAFQKLAGIIEKRS